VLFDPFREKGRVKKSIGASICSLRIFAKFPPAGDSEGSFSVFESSCHLFATCLTNHSKIGQLVKCKRTCRLVIHTRPLMLNVKQGSCEYKPLDRVDEGIEPGLPRVRCSNHYTPTSWPEVRPCSKYGSEQRVEVAELKMTRMIEMSVILLPVGQLLF